MDDQIKLGDELASAVSWLTSVGALVVMERQSGSVHVYRGQIHRVASRQSEGDTGAEILLRAIKETREAHGP